MPSIQCKIMATLDAGAWRSPSREHVEPWKTPLGVIILGVICMRRPLPQTCSSADIVCVAPLSPRASFYLPQERVRMTQYAFCVARCSSSNLSGFAPPYAVSLSARYGARFSSRMPIL